MTSEPRYIAAPVPSPLDGFVFIRDWLAGESLLRRHLPDIESMVAARLTDLEGEGWQPWTAEEVGAVADFNHEIGNPDGARMVELLGEQGALVVVTGQQPDLLNAPLYVLHKALSAIAWSQKFAERVGRPVVPVFWVASDDDDFVELKQAWHVGFDGALTDVGAKVSRGYGKLAGTPAYSWNLEESRERLLADLNRVMQGWTQGQAVVDHVASTLDDSLNFETFFCRLMVELLGPEQPMVFVAPRLKPFRDRQVDLLVADLQKHGELNVSINEAAETFESGGYPVSLHREADALNFFWIQNGLRHKLHRRDGAIVALEPRRNGVAWKTTDEELAKALASNPEDFAPNVVTRPVLQDGVLPTVAYVAGPGELAYLALLGAAYEKFGKSRAAVVPRTFVTMMPSCQTRRSTCLQQPTEIPDAILENGEGNGGEILREISELLVHSSEKLGRIRRMATGENAAVERAIDKTEKHILHGIEQLKRRLAKQVAQKEWDRASRLASLVAPAGSSQERMLSPWNFVKGGEWDGLARHLVEHIDYTAQEPQTAPLPEWIEADL